MRIGYTAGVVELVNSSRWETGACSLSSLWDPELCCGNQKRQRAHHEAGTIADAGHCDMERNERPLSIPSAIIDDPSLPVAPPVLYVSVTATGPQTIRRGYVGYTVGIGTLYEEPQANCRFPVIAI
ncbi:hypothetical protein L226DRAFT_154623 [Lentinus tigrinus ALCF2SS1-7]|uniref:uncharacterized protein n=1 Tax=Lentinus tigrinus ALCF2SS1-7 TaxID=1328758 RepID=UPI001165D97F|nr:hypothetical protein L226DRAFT_154623 [Lentinus tigrinus ALCF2SS1-7]